MKIYFSNLNKDILKKNKKKKLQTVGIVGVRTSPHRAVLVKAFLTQTPVLFWVSERSQELGSVFSIIIWNHKTDHSERNHELQCSPGTKQMIYFMRYSQRNHELQHSPGQDVLNMFYHHLETQNRPFT